MTAPMRNRLLRQINKITLWTAGFAILAMTLLGGLDVIGTVLLGYPIAGTYEATETLLVLSVFLALGFVHQERAHIAVDLFYWRMGTRSRWAIDVLTLVAMAYYFAVIAWEGWIKALESWQTGEYSVGLVQFPIYPARFALVVGASLAVLNCLVDLLEGGRFRRDAAGVDKVAARVSRTN